MPRGCRPSGPGSAPPSGLAIGPIRRAAEMPVWAVLCFPLLGFFACGCGGKAGPSFGLAVVGSDSHDFGERGQGELLTHTFSLVNAGRVPVKIDGLTTSCHCVVAGDKELGPTTVAPGARFALPVRFTTGAAQETASGRVRVGYHEVKGGSKEPGQRGSLLLSVRAAVTPDYRIVPAALDLGVIDGLKSQRVGGTFVVTPGAKADVAVREVSSSNPFLAAEILPKRAGADGVEVRVELDVSRLTQSKSVAGAVILSTDSEKAPKSHVQVRAKYQTPAEARPASIVIASAEAGEVRREIKVVTSRPSAVQDVRCTAERGVRVESDGGPPAKEHRLRVFVAPCHEAALDCELELGLRLFADGGEEVVRTLRVPVHRFLTKGGSTDG